VNNLSKGNSFKNASSLGRIQTFRCPLNSRCWSFKRACEGPARADLVEELSR
jgi:hypothetical protein